MGDYDLKEYSSKVLVTLVIIGIVSLLAYIIYYVRDILLLAFLAFIISVFIRNIVFFLERKFKLRRGMSLFFSILIIILILFLPFVSLYVPFSAQVQNLTKNLPQIISQFQDFLSGTTSLFPALSKIVNIESIVNTLTSSIQNILTGTLSYLAKASGWVVNFIIMIVIACFFAISPKEYSKMVLKFLPAKSRKPFIEILKEIEEVLKNWINGMLLAIFFVGLFTTLGFWIIGLDYFLVFGLVSGFLEIIPYFGPFLGCIAPAIYVLIQSPSKIILIIIIYLIIQFLENNFFLPIIMRKQVKLPPGVTVLVILIMGKLLGFLGIVVAIPLFAIIILLFERFVSGRKIYLSNDGE